MANITLSRHWASFYFTTIMYDDDGLDMTRRDGQPHDFDDKGLCATFHGLFGRDFLRLREEAICFGRTMETILTEEEWPEGSYYKETGDLEPAGSECRIWCRTFRALYHPKRDPAYLSSSALDAAKIAVARSLFIEHGNF